MREGLTVPASLIPEAAWGLSASFLSVPDISAHSPFGDNGVRLDLRNHLWVTLDHIQEATGIVQVVLFANDCAWVDLGEPVTDGNRPAPEEVRDRWDQWLMSRGLSPPA